MRVRIVEYRGDHLVDLFLDKRARFYLLAQRGVDLYETRATKGYEEWRLQFGHVDDAAAFIKQFLPPHVQVSGLR